MPAMFYPDVDSFGEFYRTPLGGLACRNVRERIHELWPEVGSGTKLAEPENILGIGYAPPYMMPLMENVEDQPDSYRLFCAMPQKQGAKYWPKGAANSSFLVDEYGLPFDDEQLDRVIIVHALEHSTDIQHFMREIWRVLKSGGRLIVVVPNRTGLWAHAEHTPFGHGKPFSCKQLKEILAETMFNPLTMTTELFIPPSKSHFWLKPYKLLEKIGRNYLKPCGGIVVAEAEKQLYAPTFESEKQHVNKLATAAD